VHEDARNDPLLLALDHADALALPFSRCSYEGEPTELYGDGDTGKSLMAITAWHRLA